MASRRQAGLLILLCLSLLSGCGSSPKVTDYGRLVSPADNTLWQEPSQALDLLYRQHHTWQGTPYRLGGQSRNGIDCSGFVQLTFKDIFGITLPRTTSQLVRAGQQIRKSDLKPGDLVFFRNGRHVGIYLEDDKFLHASTRLGVMISSMDNVYWSRKYWRSIRVQSQFRAR